MPFRFRLRRARRYNVSSKNSFVVCVHLLDKTLIECTLSADSSGQECLDNIAQRSELGQVSKCLAYIDRYFIGHTWNINGILLICMT